MFVTLTTLPEVDERVRFGSINVGYDKICTIRAEFALLHKLAAFACNVEEKDLTVEKVKALIIELQQTQIGA